MRARLLIVVVAAFVAGAVTAPSAARADDERWYGWQMLPSDVAAWALVAVDAELVPADSRGALQYIGVIAATLGGPIVHFANGHGGAGLGSLGLRAGALVLAAVSLALSDDRSDPTGARAARSAVVVGIAALIAAQLIDIVVIAREPAAAASAGTTTSGFPMMRFGLSF